MRKVLLGIALAVSLSSAVPLAALNTGGSTIIIPVVGRFAGAGGTQWRTDVFICNPATPTQLVTLKFYQSGGPLRQATVTLTRFASTTLTDVVLNTFGQENAAGVLEVSVAEPLSIQARATIYNTGNPAGRFGQGVPGIAKGLLSRQAFLYSLDGLNGSRVNIGVTNPNDVAVEVSFHVTDQNDIILHDRTITVAPHSYVQYNDFFTAFGIAPRAGVQVNINTFDQVIYGYASEVRNDTGDAIFSYGISPNS